MYGDKERMTSNLTTTTVTVVVFIDVIDKGYRNIVPERFMGPQISFKFTKCDMARMHS